jgi:hypothetical protein
VRSYSRAMSAVPAMSEYHRRPALELGEGAGVPYLEGRDAPLRRRRDPGLDLGSRVEARARLRGGSCQPWKTDPIGDNADLIVVEGYCAPPPYGQ